jgi:CheY-like chemotaxis protein
MPHVVIADDDYGVLYLVATLVQQLGWTSDLASDGVEAWEKVQQMVPDLVVSDINMPEMNGLDLLRAIKSSPTLAHIPVVLMSSAENEAEARAAGCDAFVAKPFGGQTILTLLPQLLPPEPSN